MPELPEVEIVKRGLEPSILNAVIQTCQLNREGLRYPFGRNFSNAVKKARVNALQRRGKYILVHLDNDITLIWHLGMSGQVKIFNDAKEYGPEKHDHVVFHFDNGVCVVFNDARRFGFLKMVKTPLWVSETHFKAMGPEPLGNQFSGEIFYEALQKRSSTIKAALLDQSVVAGVGNIYACEALYMARIHPERRAKEVSREEAEILARSIREVLLKAIESGGSSLRDYKHTDGSLGYFQHMFGVYNREGQACPECICNSDENCVIKRIVQNGRSSFFCPVLQKA